MSTQPIPTWPDKPVSPKVLLECDDPSIQDGAERALRDHGYTVAVCNGPTSRSSGRCPLVTDGQCRLVEEADVIVHALNASRDEHCEVLSAIRQHQPDTPVVIEVAATADTRAPALPATTHHVRYPMTTDSLLAAVHAAATHKSNPALPT